MVSSVRQLLAKKGDDKTSEGEISVAEIARVMKKGGSISREQSPREFAATMRKIKIKNKKKERAA